MVMSSVTKKVRSKVTKACDSCRRRKIKCTGTKPCSNCITYDCECIFASERLGGSNLNSTILNNGNSISSENDYNLNMLPASVEGTPNSGTQTPENVSGCCLKDCSISSFNGITLDLVPTLELNEEPNGFYQNDVELQKKLISLQGISKQLKSYDFLNANAIIRSSIDKINKEIDNIVESYEPKIDYARLNSIYKIKSANNDDLLANTESVESKLLPSKYGNSVHLTRYSVYSTDGEQSKDNSISTSRPIIDEIFGLYSPFLSLSFRGIGYFLQKTINYEEKIELKKTVYILLRFFDVCVDHMTMSCIAIGNPLESFLEKKENIILQFQAAGNHEFDYILSSKGRNYQNLDRDSKIIAVIETFDQSFLKELSNSTINTGLLISNMNNYFYMFGLILKLLSFHRKKYEKLMIIATKEETNSWDRGDVNKFISFCKQEELLLALAYHYYNGTLYHVDDSGSLDYLELLITLLENQFWLDDFYAVEKVLQVTVNYATRMGLSRWEFYVGISEKEAERRRNAWWKIYYFEKTHAVHKGHQSIINDSVCNALLPKEFREIGFFDLREFLSEVHLSNINLSIFQNWSIKSLLKYGSIAITMIEADYSRNILYHEKYTSIKNHSKMPFLKIQLLNEIFEYLDTTLEKVQKVETHLKKIFDIAFDEEGNGGVTKSINASVKHEIFIFVFAFYNAICNLLSATSHLLSRLFVSVVPKEFLAKLEYYHKTNCFVWSKMNLLLNLVKDEYTVARCFKYYGITSLLLISRIFKFESTIRMTDMITILNIVKRLQKTSFYSENKENAIVSSSKTYKDLSRSVSFVSVIAHIMLKTMMSEQRLDKTDLIESLSRLNPDVISIVEALLDAKSLIFEFIMKPVNETGFHLNMRKMLDYNIVCNPPNGGAEVSPNNPIKEPNVSKKQKRVAKKKEIRKHDVATPSSKSDTTSTATNGTTDPSSLGTSKPSNENLIPTSLSLPDMAKSVDISSIAKSDMLPISLSQEKLSINGKSPATDIMSPIQQSFLTNNNQAPSYNLGTLDEFINNGDLNDLYNTFWKDLYSDDYV